MKRRGKRRGGGGSVILGTPQTGAGCHGFRVVVAGVAGPIGGSWLPNSSRWSNARTRTHRHCPLPTHVISFLSSFSYPRMLHTQKNYTQIDTRLLHGESWLGFSRLLAFYVAASSPLEYTEQSTMTSAVSKYRLGTLPISVWSFHELIKV